MAPFVRSGAGWAIALTLAIDALAGLTGGLVSERALERHATALVGFAAGALVAAAFVDALPEAYRGVGAAASLWALGGFVAAALFEWGLPTHGHEEAAPRTAVPTVLLSADALHNCVDGAAIAAAWLLSSRAGLATAIAVVAHEVPEEVGDFALLRRFGWSRRGALGALFAVQLSAVLGAVAVVVATGLATHVADAVVAVAAGSFLYIGAADLLPELRAAGSRERLVGFGAGIAAVVLAGRLG